jgi:biopolymer transport protein TolR
MHGRVGREDDEPMADMNFIPLIDIALTLVIILMVTTVFMKHPGVSLKLPETVTREGAPESNKDRVIVVARDGSLYLDGEKKADAEIREHLRAIAGNNKDARILVKGDRTVFYARIMDVMDMVRQAGLTRVVLPTDPKLKPEEDPTRAETNVAQPLVGVESRGRPRASSGVAQPLVGVESRSRPRATAANEF